MLVLVLALPKERTAVAHRRSPLLPAWPGREKPLDDNVLIHDHEIKEQWEEAAKKPHTSWYHKHTPRLGQKHARTVGSVATCGAGGCDGGCYAAGSVILHALVLASANAPLPAKSTTPICVPVSVNVKGCDMTSLT